VAPPAVGTPRPRPEAPVESLAALWPASPAPESWPPRARGERRAEPEPAQDDAGTFPSAVFTPAPPSAAAPPRGATSGVNPVQQQAANSAPGVVDWSAYAAYTGTIPEPAAPAPVRDPSPSRLAYRLNRMWLTPAIRHFVRYGLPVLLVTAFVAGWLSDEGRRASLVGVFASARAAIENRPEFQVTGIDVQSRSPEVAQGVAQILDVPFPVSSFHLDFEALRETVEALDVVRNASVVVRGGTLEVRIDERVPAMIWRHPGGLDLIDAQGHRVARLANRAGRPDLPLIAGEGAPEAIAEARLLWAAATPLQPRLRGLVRIGNQRWDVVLDRDQRILLPAVGALGALERVIALDAAQDLLGRDIAVVDMRNPARPTLRLSPEALEELTRIRRLASGAQTR
jgi:cell division protein FtsQ